MATLVEGTVSKVNSNGFQIVEQQGWLNVSKYAKAEEVPMPAVGQHAKIALDKAGFVPKVEQIAPAVPPATVEG